MDRHNGLDPAEKLAALETVVQIYRHQTCLPVMAMDDVRAEINHRQRREARTAEKCKFFDILIDIAVWLHPGKIEFVVNKVECYPIHNAFQYPHILAAPVQFHIEMRLILHILLEMIRDHHVFREHDPDIKLLLIKIFWQ